jgi:ATP-dependent Lon protease
MRRACCGVACTLLFLVVQVLVRVAVTTTSTMTTIKRDRHERTSCRSHVQHCIACRVVEDLVQQDSPFRGTKRFGMCYASSQGLSAYGTVLEIVNHSVQPDGRILILCRGLDRFILKSIVKEKPVLLCNVELVRDDEDEAALADVADKARALFTQLLRMNAEHKKVPVDDALLVRPTHVI